MKNLKWNKKLNNSLYYSTWDIFQKILCIEIQKIALYALNMLVINNILKGRLLFFYPVQNRTFSSLHPPILKKKFDFFGGQYLDNRITLEQLRHTVETTVSKSTTP